MINNKEMWRKPYIIFGVFNESEGNEINEMWLQLSNGKNFKSAQL